jgi:hypothetical protein
MNINNSLFILAEGGIGDFFICGIAALNISKKKIYNNIYIYYTNVHYFTMIDYLKSFLYSNENNIILVPLKSFNTKKFDDNFYDNYLNNFNNNVDWSIINKIDNNYYTVFIQLLGKTDYFNNFFILNDIKFNDIFKINQSLNNEDIDKNILFYNKVLNNVGKDYICIFNCQERHEDIFSFKFYKNNFNKNNYPVIYFNNSEPIFNNLQIRNILGSEYPLYYYHYIIANAKEVHFVNSFPSCYFWIIFEIYKELFSNVKKYIYPRFYKGYNYSDNIFELDIKNINTMCIRQFHNMTFICPINHFFLKDLLPKNLIQKYMSNILCDGLYSFGYPKINGEKKIINNIFKILNKAYDVYDEEDLKIIKYYNKLIINFHEMNIIGIFSFNDLKKNINNIFINLINNTINDIIFDNINNLYDIIEKILNKDSNYINIIYIKSLEKPYITIKARELNNNYEIISSNDIIEDYDINFAKFIYNLHDNSYIDYIHIYNNDEDYNHYNWCMYNFLLSM